MVAKTYDFSRAVGRRIKDARLIVAVHLRMQRIDDWMEVRVFDGKDRVAQRHDVVVAGQKYEY